METYLGATKRILVAEDSPTQGALLVADLEEAGFEVTLAADGHEALERVAAGGFDLVLSDVVMPGMGGYDLCRHVKETNRDLPVVLLTSLTDPLEIVHGLEAGADNFLRKPYDANQLVERLRTMLHHRSMRASGRASIGLEVMLRDNRFLITAERQQILDLLISSFEDLVTSNHQLRERELALLAAEERLHSQLQATENERRRLSAVLDAVPNAMAIADLDGRITDVSSRLSALVGVSREELLGRMFLDDIRLVHADGSALTPGEQPMGSVLRDGERSEAGMDFNLLIERAEGDAVPVIASAAPVLDAAGHPIAVVGSLHEIGILAGHDSVTHLPNQARFAQRVHLALGDAEAPGSVAVIALVLDSYARFRERMSPAELDEILEAFAGCLTSVLADKHEDMSLSISSAVSAGHLGNGMFGVLLDGIDNELGPARIGKHIIEAVARSSFTAGGNVLRVSVSAGIATADTADDAVDLVAAAVAAARRATAAGPGATVLADSEAGTRLEDWLQQESDLRQAIDRGELVVHYQPELQLHNGRPFGAEALVRWQHPERGLLHPHDFLPLAADADLLAPIGWCVLDLACSQIATWRRTLPGAEQMILAVNFDSSQLDDPAIVERVCAALERADLDPSALIIEVTERGMARNTETTAERLRALKGLGVQVAIDDFGTGYSSLLGLRHLPIDWVKIDRTFVDGMITEPEDAAIVAATIRLAQALGLAVVAEGIETEEQLIKLRILGCDAAQGYHWAKPLDPVAFDQWWTEHRAEAFIDIPAPGAEGEASIRVDEVVSYLVHELRSPLAIVSGYAELALGDADADIAKYLEPVVRNADVLHRRLAVLSEMQATSQGQMHLDLVEHDLNTLVQTLADDLRPQLHPHPLSIQSHGEVVARIDETRFGQLLTNLLTNAAKFSGGDDSIEVHVARVGSTIELAVADHGPGVAPSKRSELFRRFSRLGARQKGMGLGLHLARSIARAHGGDIRYEDTPGGGATFRVVLPAHG